MHDNLALFIKEDFLLKGKMKTQIGFIIRCCLVEIIIAGLLYACDRPQKSNGNSNTVTNTNNTNIWSLTFKDLNGQQYRLANYRGKVLVIDFWETSCPPCLVEMPHFQALYEKYRDHCFEIIGATLDSSLEAAKTILNKKNISYLNVQATPEVQAAFGGILGLPTTFVIDRDGEIYKKYIGFRYKEVFEKDISSLLDLPLLPLEEGE